MIRVVCRLGIVASLAAGASSCAGPTAPSADVVDCSVFGDYRDSPYTLPFAVGTEFTIGRTFSHYTPLNQGVGRFAIDVDMPIGTRVFAMRRGTVVAVEDGFSDDDHATYHENWIMVRHDDDTVARYIHLTQGGALVDVGDPVAQGQLIGWSGNSGDSKGPHLHFDVQRCGPNLPPGYNPLPCGMTVPLSFRNTRPHSCGLVTGRRYRAEPFDPQ